MTLIQTSKSETLAASILDQMKEEGIIEHDADDALLTRKIKTSIRYCEAQTGCDFEDAEYSYSVPCWDKRIVLPRAPVQAVTLVQYYNTSNVLTTLEISNYYKLLPSFSAASVCPYGTLPGLFDRDDAVTITFTSGYTSLPWQAYGAISMLTVHLYENREAEITGTISTKLKFGVDNFLNQLCTVMAV